MKNVLNDLIVSIDHIIRCSNDPYSFSLNNNILDVIFFIKWTDGRPLIDSRGTPLWKYVRTFFYISKIANSYFLNFLRIRGVK